MRGEHYPSCRYHKTLPARIVKDFAEDKKLGKEWATTPAAFNAEKFEPEEIMPQPIEAAEENAECTGKSAEKTKAASKVKA